MRPAAALLLLTACGDAPAGAPDYRRDEGWRPTAVACHGCVIEHETIVRFDREWDDDGMTGVVQLVAPLGADGWLVRDNTNVGRALRFDARGRHLGEFAVRGAGPGEYRTVSWADRAARDTTWVFDGGLSRMTAWTSVSERVAEVTWTGAPLESFGTARLADGRFIRLHNHWAPRDTIVLARLARDGAQEAALPVSADWPSYGRLGRLLRLNVTAARDGIWLWSAYEPRIQRLGPDGSVVSDWRLPFTERRAPERVGGDAEPGEELLQVTDDADDVVWAALWFADTAWRSAAGQRRCVSDAECFTSIDRYTSRYDSRIVAIDARTGDVLAHRALDGLLLNAIGDGRFAYLADDDPWSLVEVRRFRLRRPGP